MVIDFHTHTFPDHIAARAIASMQSMSHTEAFCDGTVSGLTRSMAHAGIDRSVVLPVATNPLKLQSMNNASLAQNGRDGLIYFGAVHPLAETGRKNWTALPGRESGVLRSILFIRKRILTTSAICGS